MVAKAPSRLKVFISHAPGDDDAARAIAAELRQAGFSVFVPAEAMLPGDNVMLAIGKALESADAMVIVLSPEWTRSPNLVLEMGFALGKERFAGRLIPVVVKETDDVPWILRRLDIVEATKDTSRAGRKVAMRLGERAEVARQ